MKEIRENNKCNINDSGIQIIVNYATKEDEKSLKDIEQNIRSFSVSFNMKATKRALIKYQPRFAIHALLTSNLILHKDNNYNSINSSVQYLEFLLQNDVLDENGLYEVNRMEGLYISKEEIRRKITELNESLSKNKTYLKFPNTEKLLEREEVSLLIPEEAQVPNAIKHKFKKNYSDREVIKFAVQEALKNDDLLLMKKTISECDEDNVESLIIENIVIINTYLNRRKEYYLKKFRQYPYSYCYYGESCFYSSFRVLWYLFQENILLRDNTIYDWRNNKVKGQEIYNQLEPYHQTKVIA